MFRISQLVETESAYRFHMAASHQGKIVGIDVSVVKGIQAGLDEAARPIRGHVYRDGVRFFRSGPESDRLVLALARLYGQEHRTLEMLDELRFTGIALHQGAIDPIREAVKIKLFGHDRENGDEDYNESFFNLDLPNGLVFWNEKDQDYRRPLVRALSRPVSKNR